MKYIITRYVVSLSNGSKITKTFDYGNMPDENYCNNIEAFRRMIKDRFISLLEGSNLQVESVYLVYDENN